MELAINTCAYTGSAAQMKRLIHAGIDVTVNEHRAMKIAAQYGHVDLAKILLETLKKSYSVRLHTKVMMHAVANGKAEIVKLMLKVILRLHLMTW